MNLASRCRTNLLALLTDPTVPNSTCQTEATVPPAVVRAVMVPAAPNPHMDSNRVLHNRMAMVLPPDRPAATEPNLAVLANQLRPMAPLDRLPQPIRPRPPDKLPLPNTALPPGNRVCNTVLPSNSSCRLLLMTSSRLLWRTRATPTRQ